MLLSINENPKNGLYYNGYLILSLTQKNKKYDYFELYKQLKDKYDMSMYIYTLTLDWLFLVSAMQTTDDGRLIRCS